MKCFAHSKPTSIKLFVTKMFRLPKVKNKSPNPAKAEGDSIYLLHVMTDPVRLFKVIESHLKMMF